LHVSGFGLGGLTFIIGTGLFFLDQTPAIATTAAILYIIGSCGFLTVDVMEFFTPAYRWCPLRGNIALNAVGSALYVAGSVGFLPTIMNVNNALGVWGFILGSALIGMGEIWKIARLATPPSDEEMDGYSPSSSHLKGHTPVSKPGPSLAHVFSSADVLSATGTEIGAFIGAWAFLIGTAMFDVSVTPLQWYDEVLGTWMLGSVGFTFGACCMAYRHFWLCIS
jgi:hypothetical protein